MKALFSVDFKKVFFYFILILSIKGCKFNGNYISKGNRYKIHINDVDKRYFYLDRYLKSNQIFSQGNYQKIGFGKYLLIPDAPTLKIIGKSKDTSFGSDILFRMDSSCICSRTDYEFYSVDSQKTISLREGIRLNNAMDSSLPTIILSQNCFTYYLDTSGMEDGYNVYYIEPSFITNMSYDFLIDTGYIVQRFGKLYYSSNTKWYKNGWRTSAVKKTNQPLVWPKLFYCYFKEY